MAQLTIEYDKDILGSGYYMKTEVLPFPATEPAGTLEESIIIQEASTTQDERILRIASPTELVELAVAAPLVFFSATEFSGVTVNPGDTLRLPMRDEWVKLGHVGMFLDFMVLAQFGAIIEIDVAGAVYPFPSFCRGVFQVFSGYPGPSGPLPWPIPYVTGSNGYTVRNSVGNSDAVRVSEHVDMFSDIIVGANKQEALSAEAQALIDATNIDETEFSGVDVEVYE